MRMGIHKDTFMIYMYIKSILYYLIILISYVLIWDLLSAAIARGYYFLMIGIHAFLLSTMYMALYCTKQTLLLKVIIIMGVASYQIITFAPFK